ncbi:MAG TPA: ergothioneine biosynthesis protein EgtB [Acidimicrobiales bacterium]|nr:ergothioneine biosynthesis protein EgtB [Acidimicrobiales bacterium]
MTVGTGRPGELQPETQAALAQDVRTGLGAHPKWLPSRWLYEGAGSKLFELITELDEYYPTRAERAILAEHAKDIVLLSGARKLIELGSGTSDKTRLLLDAFDEVDQLDAFIALDAVEHALQGSVDELAARYPRTAVSKVTADFDADFSGISGGPGRLLLFLGGTIGNLGPTERARLLLRFADLLDDGEHLLLGTDLVKDAARLVAAYDDAQGVTAAFEKNVLDVVNANLGADFDLDRFEYVARWDEQLEVVDMVLRSLGAQDVTIPSLGLSVHFDDGEELRTEISAKFHLAGVEQELGLAGFDLVEQWQDAGGDFALTLARKERTGAGVTRDREGERFEKPPHSAPAASLEGYREVRAATEALARQLSAEDQTIQSMPDVSPTKWHRGHVTWFFEQFALIPHRLGYRPMDEEYLFLFNSYYEGAGRRHSRGERGLLSRPGIVEIKAYRETVDEAMESLLIAGPSQNVSALVELGLHHEQQHQELLLMDIKHVLGVNPIAPSYRPDSISAVTVHATESLGWVAHPGGLVEIGADSPANSTGAMDFTCGFVFDNESPRHRAWLEPFALADRLVTAGEWLEFMEDGGYDRANLWLSDGWAVNQAERREAPMYWRKGRDGWEVFTLNGRRPLRSDEPMVHVSYYEADAFARWAGARLPTEVEWEAVAAMGPLPEVKPVALHPRPASPARFQGETRQLFGETWQWTSSAYLPYPRFEPLKGVVGEYNGKFMVSQHVLRGSAAITPPGHARVTYRNFFPPGARWPFTGVRLARDI